MKIELRWQLLLVALCIALLISLVGFQVAQQQDSSCLTEIAAPGGYLIEGVVGQPHYLNPLLSDGNPVDQDLSMLIFDGLTSYDESGFLQPALAKSWEISEDGLTYRFTLRDDVSWHDGEPVTNQDVAFSYGLLQNPSFQAPESLRVLWEPIKIELTGDDEITFTLPEPFSPFLDATTRGIIPEHILGGVLPNSVKDHPFNSSPIGTGPFVVNPGSDWDSDGFLRMSPNPLWWREGTLLDGLEYRFFSNGDELIDSLIAGDIQSAVLLPGQAVEAMGSLADVKLFSSAAPRYTELLFNMRSPSNTAMNDIEVRRALAHSLDRSALIEEALYDQGLPLEGPYLPSSWAYNPGIMAPIEHDIQAAITNLEAAGWTSPEGVSPRTRGDTPLVLTLLIQDSERRRKVAQNMIDQWQKVGIGIDLTAVGATEFRQFLEEGQFDIALVDVEPNADPDLYDFWSQEAIIDGQNYSGWNNRLGSEALEEARKTTKIQDRQSYYDSFLEFFRKDLPSLTLYQHLITYAISNDVMAAEVGRIDTPRERYDTFADWYTGQHEVAAPCPGDQTT